jgi:hypothetical protein
MPCAIHQTNEENGLLVFSSLIYFKSDQSVEERRKKHDPASGQQRSSSTCEARISNQREAPRDDLHELMHATEVGATTEESILSLS